MTFLGKLRRRPRLIRSVFAVFVLAWLQTAILPCASAMTRSEQAAPIGSDQSIEVTASTAGTAISAMPDMPDCVYCPSEQKQSGDVGASAHGCLYPHESQVDSGKAHQLQVDHLVAHPVFVSSSIFSFVLEQSEATPSRRYLIPPLSPRSLNLTYCKQLK